MPDPSLARVFLDSGADYDRYRPGFPEAAVDLLTASGPRGDSASLAALDLGAGTGKLTERLVSRVARVIAVDPSAPMLAELSRKLPAVEVHVAAAESLPLAGGCVDLVTVAQAFHCFDRDAACAEMARVLRPNGVLALVWNVADPACGWDVDCTAIAHGREPGDPPDPDDEYDPHSAPVPPVAPGFAPFHAERITWSEPLPREHYLRRWMTVSRLLAASDEERAAMLDRMAGLLDAAAETAGRDILPLTNVTEVFLYRADEGPRR
jgi:SAM-dependent methyltransferase